MQRIGALVLLAALGGSAAGCCLQGLCYAAGCCDVDPSAALAAETVTTERTPPELPVAEGVDAQRY